MSNVLLLDCTLRDGGYINNWMFGKKCMWDFSQRMAHTGIDIFEGGFIRSEENKEDRAVWNSVESASESICMRNSNVQYAIMAEGFNPLPLSEISMHTEDTIGLIRVIVWKRLLSESCEYCKGLIEKGYKVSIQPDRVNQYSDEEFKSMIHKMNELHPWAVYVVDSNGVLDRLELMRYFEMAHEYLDNGIKLGYHGHNNKQQALGGAESLVEKEFERDIIIDGTIFGIGRSSGNLNIELFAEYMNKHWNKNYDIAEMISLFGEYILPIYERKPWGYSMEHFITALHTCNPNYGAFLREKGYTMQEIYDIVANLSSQDKVIFNRDILE